MNYHLTFLDTYFNIGDPFYHKIVILADLISQKHVASYCMQKKKFPPTLERHNINLEI